ncbi:myosin-iiia [Plakobranchus ocellatus]|uniref:Myosin-iiia n=1 Tax=Plakobranchus ocellatus TaxID=259542 RepID=A0AAV4B373_9GAST|nr:myosin-iiia [Plakobranchus ocellatus]
MLEQNMDNGTEEKELNLTNDPPKLAPAERVLNKTAASRNSQRTKKNKEITDNGIKHQPDKSTPSEGPGQLNLSKTEKNKIRELGFPVRLLFEDFISKYKIIVFSPASDIEPTAEHCRFIAKRANLREYEITESKILLSYADVSCLNKLRRDEEKKIIRAQAQIRGYLARSRSGKLKPPGPASGEFSAPESRRSSDETSFAPDQSPCSTLSTRSGVSALDAHSLTAMIKKSPEVFNKAKCEGREGEENLAITDTSEADRRSSKIFREHLQDTLEKLGSQPDMKGMAMYQDAPSSLRKREKYVMMFGVDLQGLKGKAIYLE